MSETVSKYITGEEYKTLLTAVGGNDSSLVDSYIITDSLFVPEDASHISRVREVHGSVFTSNNKNINFGIQVIHGNLLAGDSEGLNFTDLKSVGGLTEVTESKDFHAEKLEICEGVDAQGAENLFFGNKETIFKGQVRKPNGDVVAPNDKGILAHQ
jgi:hypothetical protein